jgi:cellulose synthase/poly-beta-1,6-N-acetylglucosamine synthase-like glycosyltransferase
MSHLLASGEDPRTLIGMALVTVAVAGTAYAYIGYPALLWLLSKLVPGRGAVPTTNLGLTMIIAAHNEEAGIREKLEDTLRLNYAREKLQVIVASDGSTDRTNQIVREFQDRGVELLEIPDRLGKTNAQNQAVLQARNPILVFSDATTQYDCNALQYLAGAYCDPSVGAASGRYDYFDPTSGSPAGTGSAKFWNLENWIKRSQSRIYSLSGCCGCIYSVRRDVYTVLAPETISDLVQPLHVILRGYRVIFQEPAHAREEATRSTRDEFRMRVRVATRGMIGLMSVPAVLMPWKYPWIAFQLWSHKIVRWCIPLFLLLLFTGSLCLVSKPVFLVFLCIQVLFYGLALASLAVPGLRRSRLLSLPLYFCTINTAFLLGILNAVRGRQFSTWQPVRG